MFAEKIQNLDSFFPYLVFFYGAFVTFVLEIPALQDLLLKQQGQAFRDLWMRREFALTCLIVGSAWTLQNLWF